MKNIIKCLSSNAAVFGSGIVRVIVLDFQDTGHDRWSLIECNEMTLT